MKKIKIFPTDSDFLEKINYENMALVNLITFLLKNEINTDSKNYQNLYNMYLEKNLELNIAKKQIAKQYNINSPWQINFNTQEIMIYEPKNNDE